MSSFDLRVALLIGLLFAVGASEVVQAQDTDPVLPTEAPSVRDTADHELIYVPTPMDVVDQMIELAGVTTRDTVYDLGSGDGRIVIRAAEKYGAYGVGLELDPDLVEEARENARDAGVTDQVEFREKNFFEADISDATVLLLYLLPEKLQKLQPKLINELGGGTPIVTHDFQFEAWEPEQRVQVSNSMDGWGQQKTIYLWRVPE
jgi:SAM-dependent methyltransferase